MKPLAVDLCCGLGGWSEGLLAEGWDVVGFDVERHRYGEHKYPAQLVLQDILTLTGEQFRGKVSLIVASPPCQFFSYTAMPWTKAKALAAKVRADPLLLAKELALFDACVRIGKEAQCPIVIENVRGAQPWVGRARWAYGSFFLWGDVPALMPMRGAGTEAFKLRDADGERNHPNAFGWKSPRTSSGSPGRAHNTTSGKGRNPDGRKAPAGTQWFNDGPRTKDSLASMGSKSSARKAASAMIAKIPLPLSRWIAAVYRKESHMLVTLKPMQRDLLTGELVHGKPRAGSGRHIRLKSTGLEPVKAPGMAHFPGTGPEGKYCSGRCRKPTNKAGEDDSLPVRVEHDACLKAAHLFDGVVQRGGIGANRACKYFEPK